MSTWILEAIRRSLGGVDSVSAQRSDCSPADLYEFERDAIRTWRSRRRVALAVLLSLAVAAPLTCVSNGAAAKEKGHHEKHKGVPDLNTRDDGFAAPDRLIVRYLDCLNGTPLLDVKPYLPSTDAEPEATMGWLAKHRTMRHSPA